MTPLESKLEQLVAGLTDAYRWNWTDMNSRRDAATSVLFEMAHIGLVEHRDHPFGGDIWRVNGSLYGRTDGITNKKFDKLPQESV